MASYHDPRVTCCFTGHRPQKLPWGINESDPRCIKLQNTLHDVVEALYISGYRHFICGMAMGCDFLFCEAVLRLRSEYLGVTLEAAIPCEEQAARWSEKMRDRYFYLIEQCDEETLLQTRYTPDCMIKRNRYMIDRSSHLIAVHTPGVFGGTLQAARYAQKQGLTVTHIRP